MKNLTQTQIESITGGIVGEGYLSITQYGQKKPDIRYE